MGRGARSGTLQGAPVRRSSAAVLEMEIEPARPLIAWHEAAGPEATDAELLAWSEERGRHWSERYPNGKSTGAQEAARQLEGARETIRVLSEGGLVVDARQRAGYSTRRSLEAVLALYAGQPLEAWRAANADRPWSSLLEQASGISGATYEAGQVESALLSFHQRDHRLPELADAVQRASGKVDADLMEENRGRLSNLIARRDLGQQTGRPEDYSRRELRRLLGFRERDCKHLTDDELRSMCLDGHLMPRWEGSPSHVDLALAASVSGGYYDDPSLAENFTKAMRSPYDDLVRHHGFRLDSQDKGYRPTEEIITELHAINPLIASVHADPISVSRSLRETATTTGVAVDLPVSSKHGGEGATIKKQTAMELQFRPALDDFCATFHPTRRPVTISGKLPAGSRGCYGLYRSATGEIAINSSLTKLIDRAKAGNAAPIEVERAVSTVAHELIHSIEGRDQGSGRTHSKSTETPEHTLDEGTTEALARVHTQRLAESMGLWRSEDGDLRQHAETGSYQSEVATVLTLGQALWGTWDGERARAGINQPEDVDPQVLVELEKLHVAHGPWGRMEVMRRRLQELNGGDERPDEAIHLLLQECKNKRYQWSTERYTHQDPETGQTRPAYRHVEPENLAHNLADMIESILP